MAFSCDACVKVWKHAWLGFSSQPGCSRLVSGLYRPLRTVQLRPPTSGGVWKLVLSRHALVTSICIRVGDLQMPSISWLGDVLPNPKMHVISGRNVHLHLEFKKIAFARLRLRTFFMSFWAPVFWSPHQFGLMFWLGRKPSFFTLGELHMFPSLKVFSSAQLGNSD
jgi:hypothetical protein